MNRIVIGLLSTVLIVLGVLVTLQHADLALLREKNTMLTAELEAARKAAEAARTLAEAAKEEIQTLKENTQRLTAERDAAKLKPGPAAPTDKSQQPAPKDDITKGIASMFNTKEGKEMMRSQMQMVMKMQYGALAREMGLDTATADQVMQLLIDRQLKMSEDMLGDMAALNDPEKMKRITEKAKTSQEEFEKQLKAILGEEGMKQFKDYERTVGDRMMMQQYDMQFSAAGVPLEAAQRDGLLQIIKQERQNTPRSVFESGGSNDPAAAMRAMQDDAAIDAWMKSEEDFQRRVLQKAPQALSPDQVNALSEAFKQQATMQKMGMKMGREMFKGGAQK